MVIDEYLISYAMQERLDQDTTFIIDRIHSLLVNMLNKYIEKEIRAKIPVTLEEIEN
jgi:hypothetical protein